MALYMRKVATDGLILLHISNRFLDLEPVVAAVAAELGHAALAGEVRRVDGEKDPAGAPSRWLAVSRNRSLLDALDLGEHWRPVEMPAVRVWRDDFSSLLDVIRWRGSDRAQTP